MARASGLRRSQMVPDLSQRSETLPRGFVDLQRAQTEAGEGGNICTPMSWQGRLWGSTVAIEVPAIGKGWAGIATGYGKAS